MKMISALPAVVTALSLLMLASGPVIAKKPYCTQKRTVAVGKDGYSEMMAYNKCLHALDAKGKATPNFAYHIDKLGSCEELGGKNGGDYWQCICSARACKWISLESYTPPGPLKPKFERQLRGSEMPDRSFRMPRSFSSPLKRR